MSEPAQASHVVPAEAVSAAIDSFTALDAAGDRRAMNDLARRLGKEQPALLQAAGRLQAEHGEQTGQAAVFYSTLVWAMFEKHLGKSLPRLLPANITDARKVVDDERAAVEGLADRPVHERVAPGVVERQPHVLARLQELIAEDVKEAAITAETAELIFGPTQTAVEAFDAAIAGRRPGQNMAPVVRSEPKVGRNDPCPCGSGKKYKRCHGAAVA